MTFKANIDAQVRGFYFAESGNDDFDGATFERPKLTIQAAIDEALALDPIPQVGNVALVTVAQGGSFDETVVMSDWIQFNAEDVTITSAASVLIDLASFLSFRISGAINTQVGGTCFEVDGVQSLGLESLFMASSGIGLNITGACDDLFFTISRVNISAIGGVGINITSSTVSPIDININTVSMDANDTTFIVYEPVSGITSMKISTISFDGATGTTIAECKAGNLVISGDVMQSETFAVMTGTAQLTVNVQVITGETMLNDSSVVTFKPVTQYIGDINVFDAATLFADIQIFFGNLHVDPNTNSVFNCGFMQGDLNVNGTLFCHINSHIGNINGSGTINGIINGVPFGIYRQKPEETLLLNASSFLTQSPAGTDTLLQVEFGAAQFGPTDPVQISAAGAITINQADQYEVFLVFQYGRSGAAGGTSILMFRALRNGIQVGLTRYAQLDNPNSAFPVEFTVPLNGVPGDVITFEVWRDSTGFDAGDLIPFIPTLVGPNASSSAAVSMTKKRLVQPVD